MEKRARSSQHYSRWVVIFVFVYAALPHLIKLAFGHQEQSKRKVSVSMPAMGGRFKWIVDNFHSAHTDNRVTEAKNIINTSSVPKIKW